MSFVIIAGILSVTYLLLIIFYTIGWKRVKVFNADRNQPSTTVNVIVPARNEEESILDCVYSIISQDYPQDLFEIIVVDDNSEDQTLQKLEEINHPNLKVLSLKVNSHNSRSFKKQAIAYGIEHSKSDLIITTDADCVADDRWLSTVVSFYEKHHPKMITAPVIFSEEESFLKKWQQLDLIGMMGVTAGAIGSSFPNMCNGANLAYERGVFYEVGGFTDIDHIPTGDDILLMLKIKQRYPDGIRFLKSREAIIQTKPENNLSDLFMQRLRWVSKATAFQDKRLLIVLALAYLFNAMILLSLMAGIVSTNFLIMGILMFVLKLMIEFPLMLAASKFFKKQGLLVYLVPVQFLHIIYTVIIGLLSKIYPYRWKGRKYNGLNKAHALSASKQVSSG